MGLTIPLIARGTSDFCGYFNQEYEKHTKQYNLTFHFVFDQIPIVFQYLSLIFGYIRYRNEKSRVAVEAHMAQIRRGDIDFRSSEQSSECFDSSNNTYSRSSYFEPPLRGSRKESVKEVPSQGMISDNDSWTRKSQSDNDLHHQFNLSTMDAVITQNVAQENYLKLNPHHLSGGFKLTT